MFNFLNSKLLPKVYCKSPCTDNYEAENLISDQYSSRMRGFIAYPSIKPPVEIEFEFLCNINIFYILLNTTVGNQKCSGVEVFARNPNTPYVSIARAIYDAQGLVFCNSRKYSKDSPPPCYNPNYSLNFFKGGTFRTFLNASKLKIVIFRTERLVPCLAAVEIWGVPSRACSQKTVETLHRLMGQSGAKNEDNISSKPKSLNNPDSFTIPDDFKDDLTYDLMTIPYTLPSGKSIDQTTLEKHEASEKSFGRKPCDPFTGIKFTDTLKPVLNVALKSRIDMFLLENSHRTETFGLKRSLRSESNVNKRLKSDNYSLDKNIVQSTPDVSNSRDDLDSLIVKGRTDINFVSFSNTDQDYKATCMFCNGSFQFLYELCCKHLYCRKCMLEICKDCTCKKCGQSFVKSDVVKRDL